MPLKPAMRADGAHRHRQGIVIGKQGPAIAEAAQRLGRKEAGAGNGGYPATAAPVAGRPETL